MCLLFLYADIRVHAANTDFCGVLASIWSGLCSCCCIMWLFLCLRRLCDVAFCVGLAVVFSRCVSVREDDFWKSWFCSFLCLLLSRLHFFGIPVRVLLKICCLPLVVAILVIRSFLSFLSCGSLMPSEVRKAFFAVRWTLPILCWFFSAPRLVCLEFRRD